MPRERGSGGGPEFENKKKTFYEILGVANDATDEEIRSAYIQRIKDTHPDKPENFGKEQEAKEINEAYQVLRDSQKRSLYDKAGNSEAKNETEAVNYTGEQAVSAWMEYSKKIRWHPEGPKWRSRVAKLSNTAGGYWNRKIYKDDLFIIDPIEKITGEGQEQKIEKGYKIIFGKLRSDYGNWHFFIENNEGQVVFSNTVSTRDTILKWLKNNDYIKK